MSRSSIEVVQAGLVRQVPTELHASAPGPFWLYMQSTLYTIATAVLPRAQGRGRSAA